MKWLALLLIGFVIYLYWVDAFPRQLVTTREQIPYFIEFLLAQGAYVGGKCLFCVAGKSRQRIVLRKYVNETGLGCLLEVQESRWGSETFDRFLDALASIGTSSVVSLDRRNTRLLSLDCKDDIGLANMLIRRFFSIALGGELEGHVVVKLRNVMWENKERLSKVAVVERGKLPRRRPWGSD